MHYGMHAEVNGQLSIYHMGSRTSTRLLRPGSKCPQLLSSLSRANLVLPRAMLGISSAWSSWLFLFIPVVASVVSDHQWAYVLPVSLVFCFVFSFSLLFGLPTIADISQALKPTSGGKIILSQLGPECQTQLLRLLGGRCFCLLSPLPDYVELFYHLSTVPLRPCLYRNGWERG